MHFNFDVLLLPESGVYIVAAPLGWALHLKKTYTDERVGFHNAAELSHFLNQRVALLRPDKTASDEQFN